MEVTEFSLDRDATIESLFSPAISSDSWVLYHATTSVAEEGIDTAGLIPSLDYDATLIKLIKIFRAMNWFGENSAGYPVLKGFSLQRGSLPNLYFRESSTRSLLYATSDFAGGETARAMYHALEDLKRYAADPSVRAHHYDRQVAHCKDLVEQNGCPTHVIRVDVTWLLERLLEFEEFGQKVAELKRSYRYGVVYAVRFDRDDVPFLTNCGGSGIVFSRAVPVAKLVGKARVYQDADGQYPDLEQHAGSWHFEDAESELMELLSRRSSATADAGQHHREREGLCEIDAYAGPDDAIDIARRWGTPEIQQMIASSKIRFNEYW